MTALAKDRIGTACRSTGYLESYKVAASTKIYNGALVALNATGYLVPAANTAGLRVVGRADQQVDNSSGADGDKSCQVHQGIFKWKNGTSAVAQAHIGHPVYAEDDQTVGALGGATVSKQVIAGIAVEIDADGDIWVQTAPATRPPESSLEVVTIAGAIAPELRTTLLDVTGTVAYTLADGKYDGQRKTIKARAAGGTPHGQVAPSGTTLSAANGGFAQLDFTSALGSAELEWHSAASAPAAGWYLVGVSGSGVTVS